MVGTDLTSACVRAQYAGLVANLVAGAGGRRSRAGRLSGADRRSQASGGGEHRRSRASTPRPMLVLVAVALPFAGVPPVIVEIVLRRAGSVDRWRNCRRHRRCDWRSACCFMRSRRSGHRPPRRGRIGSDVAQEATLAGGVGDLVLVQGAFVMTNVWLARQVGVTTGLAAWFVAWPLVEARGGPADQPRLASACGKRRCVLIALAVWRAARSCAGVGDSVAGRS